MTEIDWVHIYRQRGGHKEVSDVVFTEAIVSNNSGGRVFIPKVRITDAIVDNLVVPGSTVSFAAAGGSFAKGASAAVNVITLGFADGTNPGLMSTGGQSFAGEKLFLGGAGVAATTKLFLDGGGASSSYLSEISPGVVDFVVDGIVVTKFDGADSKVVFNNQVRTTGGTAGQPNIMEYTAFAPVAFGKNNFGTENHNAALVLREGALPDNSALTMGPGFNTPLGSAYGGIQYYSDTATPVASIILLNPEGGSIGLGGLVALATTATSGYIYTQTTAGVPTGVPGTVPGQAATVIDTTNDKAYFYNAAWIPMGISIGAEETAGGGSSANLFATGLHDVYHGRYITVPATTGFYQIVKFEWSQGTNSTGSIILQAWRVDSTNPTTVVGVACAAWGATTPVGLIGLRQQNLVHSELIAGGTLLWVTLYYDDTNNRFRGVVVANTNTQKNRAYSAVPRVGLDEAWVGSTVQPFITVTWKKVF